jgi:hypothetical protein
MQLFYINTNLVHEDYENPITMHVNRDIFLSLNPAKELKVNLFVQPLEFETEEHFVQLGEPT